MIRFFKWWSGRFFDLDVDISGDILPVIPGKIFDRVGIAYLARDHKDREKGVFHLYLTYFRPTWSDCKTEGYYGDGFGMAYWKRPKDKENMHEIQRMELFASDNCPRVSHVLAHQLLKMKGKTKQNYFGSVHEVWEKHQSKKLPFLYFNSEYHRTREDAPFRFSTIDPGAL